MPEPMVLLLEDGFELFGERGGQAMEASGEVVINTSMTGYQEVLSDPSYAGQMVVMTYPLIGNYGATADFQESARPWARALITRQLSRFEEHWRSHQSLVEWLDGFGVPIMTGCDTRRLARHLRTTGAQRAIIGPRQELASLRERLQRVPALEEQDLVRQVSEGFSDVVEPLDPALYSLSPSGGGQGGGFRQWPGLRVVVIDYGVKRNILRSLRSRGVEVDVLPYNSDLQAILDRRPDAVVLSNGPGDPAQLQPAGAMTRAFIQHLPVLGICLGHQLIAQAAGAPEHGTGDRLGADRHRPGGRVRLCRDASLQSLARGRRSHGAGQLEPGNDHDRRGRRRPRVHRAADGGGGDGHHRTRAARWSVGHPGWADWAQPRGRPCRRWGAGTVPCARAGNADGGNPGSRRPGGVQERPASNRRTSPG